MKIETRDKLVFLWLKFWVYGFIAWLIYCTLCVWFPSIPLVGTK